MKRLFPRLLNTFAEKSWLHTAHYLYNLKHITAIRLTGKDCCGYTDLIYIPYPDKGMVECLKRSAEAEDKEPWEK